MQREFRFHHANLEAKRVEPDEAEDVVVAEWSRRWWDVEDSCWWVVGETPDARRLEVAFEDDGHTLYVFHAMNARFDKSRRRKRRE